MKPTLEDIGAKVVLKCCRKKRKYSQSKLALKSGVGRTYIVEIEKGKYDNVGLKVVCKLAKSLKCTLNDLVEQDWEVEGW